MKLILGIIGQPKTVNCAGTEHVIQAVSAIVFEPGLAGGVGGPGIPQRPALWDFGKGERVSGRESCMSKSLEAGEARNREETRSPWVMLGDTELGRK